MDIKVEGLRELDSALADLVAEFGPKSAGQAVRPALRKASAPIKAAVDANTPVASGTLLGSAKLRIKKPTKKMIAGMGGHHKESHILTATIGYEWSNPSLWNQALSVEFGNSHSPEQAPLRRALRSNANTALDTLSRELAISIEKAAKKLLNKR